MIVDIRRTCIIPEVVLCLLMKGLIKPENEIKGDSNT